MLSANHIGASTPATARGRERRERLLNAAAALVAERGFHAVGIIDIGAAAGVTGSAIYRHFKSKGDLLVALFERVIDNLVEGAQTTVADGGPAPDVLETLIGQHVAFALRDRAIIAVYEHEVANLPVDDRRRLRRKQRVYADLWSGPVAAVRPDLADAEVEAAVHAVFGLLSSVARFRTRSSERELAALLTTMATAALSPTRVG
jgi:AcrR family transcriptional regulator